jgi:hypothetical protein
VGEQHAILVEIAVRWLRNQRRCARVFAEFTTAAPSIPDAIGWRGQWSELVEVKVSRSDFFADRKKPHVAGGRCMGNVRWYLTPPGLVRREELPAGWGLAECAGRVRVIVEPVAQDAPDKDREVLLLLSAIRRFELGVPWDEKRGRFQTVAEQAALAGEETPEDVARSLDSGGPLFAKGGP